MIYVCLVGPFPTIIRYVFLLLFYEIMVCLTHFSGIYSVRGLSVNLVRSFKNPLMFLSICLSQRSFLAVEYCVTFLGSPLVCPHDLTTDPTVVFGQALTLSVMHLLIFFHALTGRYWPTLRQMAWDLKGSSSDTCFIPPAEILALKLLLFREITTLRYVEDR